MVFSSKANTLFTQMFLTHIDEEGNDTPYVLVPNATAANRAVNLPEFVNISPDELETITVPAVNHHRYYLTGSELLKNGKYTEAVDELQKAIDADPDFVRAHVEIAFALGRLDENDRAWQHYERLLRLDPRNSAAFNGKGCVLGERGEEDQAIAAFQQAIAYDPYYFPALMNLGVALQRAGRYEEAVRHLKSAASVRPRDTAIHKELSETYLEMGSVAEAVRHLDHAAGLDPTDYRSASVLAWFLATHPDPAVRDGKRAVAAALQACRQSGFELPETLDALAAAYAEVGDFDKAAGTATRAVDTARRKGNARLARLISQRRQLYLQKKPYRQPAR